MKYDLIIIGGGWAGFNAALAARESGLKVALIEREKLGGTCLNYGCIPTKSLIQSAKVYNLIKKATTFGVLAQTAPPEFAQIKSRKDNLIQRLQQGMRSLLSGIDFFEDHARIISRDTVKVGQRQFQTKFILISSGSKTQELPNLKIDGHKVISSTEALELKELPSSILIIGGGVIGCEFAGLFSTLGVKVAIVEKLPQLLPGMQRDIAGKIENIFRKRGINVMLDSDVFDAAVNKDSYAKLLLCIGRTSNTEGLGLEELGIATQNSRIIIDNNLRTSVSNIYAAGDCASKVMLAHFAAYQGKLAVRNMVSLRPLKFNSAVIPNCIFTDPEVASVGINEEEAERLAMNIRVHRFDFMGSGMAHILDESEGFIKVISLKRSGQVLGAVVIGPRATELIGIMTLAVTKRLKVQQIRDTIFAHPSLSESISEALKDSHEVRTI